MNADNRPGPGTVGSPLDPNADGLDRLRNVILDLCVELGRAQVPLADVLAYDVGSIIELHRAAGTPVDVRVNDSMLAEGEVLIVDDDYAVRLTAIHDPFRKA